MAEDGNKKQGEKKARGGSHGASLAASQPPHRGERERTEEREREEVPFPRRLRPQPHPPHGRAAGWGPRRRRRGPDAGGPAAPRRRRRSSDRPRGRQGERFSSAAGRVVPAARSGSAGGRRISLSPRFVFPPLAIWWFPRSIRA